MSEQLEERFTDGVWYDLQHGDFSEIVETESGDVGLVEPGQDEPFHVVDIEDWNEHEKHEFRKVSKRAVDNPAACLQDYLEEQLPPDFHRDDYVDIMYAEMNAKIVAEER